MESSSVETEDDVNTFAIRQRKRPRRFVSESSDDDDSAPVVAATKKQPKTRTVPGSPVGRTQCPYHHNGQHQPGLEPVITTLAQVLLTLFKPAAGHYTQFSQPGTSKNHWKPLLTLFKPAAGRFMTDRVSWLSQPCLRESQRPTGVA
ncbi:uncharacterized protein LOC132897939 isoform X5 [Neoarius graeffei]|uniref:uncharacterized protein LOC132897939 isoform X5 n=1 Tax=Neoarius graeffei TaxID=443677 RepID=UPI00298D4CEF|nr:uncharacterized protein LOC132897939 isoform X5 [Neoarius graeffei]